MLAFAAALLTHTEREPEREMIYSISPIIQTNIGSRGRASIGEPFEPGDAQDRLSEEREVPEQPTKSQTSKNLNVRKKPKHYESHKVRAAREMREGVLAYRAHRVLEERAACKAREELARANEVIKAQLERQARATFKNRRACHLAKTPPEAPQERGAQGARAHWWTRRLATPRTPINLTTSTESTCSLPYLPTFPYGTESMSARHWYDMELEHGRSAMVGVFESLIPTTNGSTIRS